MNWKVLAIGGVTLLLLVLVAYYFQNNISTFVRSGFQSGPNPTTSPATKEFILYYADWCPHCKNVLPEFQKLAPNGSVVVGGQNVTVRTYEQAKNKDKFQGKNIKGFPTIMFSDVDGTTTEYKGSRTADAFLQFLNERLGGGVQNSSNAVSESFKNKKKQGFQNPPPVKRLPPNTKLPQLNK